MQGILGDIEALLFGRPYKYTAQESEELDRQIMKVVAEESATPNSRLSQIWISGTVSRNGSCPSASQQK